MMLFNRNLTTLVLLLAIVVLSPPAVFAEEDASEKAQVGLKEQADIIRQQILSKEPRFAVQGELRAVSGGSYAVNNLVFQIDEFTRVYGVMKPGALVRVVGYKKGAANIAKVINVGKTGEKLKRASQGKPGVATGADGVAPLKAPKNSISSK